MKTEPPACFPGKAHHWLINQLNLGVCQLCGAEWQFIPRTKASLLAIKKRGRPQKVSLDDGVF